MDIGRKVKDLFLGNSIGRPSAFFWNWNTPGEWTEEEQLKQYSRYVYPVVSAIAEDFARINFQVQSKTGITLKKHPFISFMQKPNEQQSQFQFLELHQTFMELAGESFWYLIPTKTSRKPTEAILLRPDYVDVVVDDNEETNPLGYVTGYVYNRPDGEKVPLEYDEVLHHKMPNPINPHRGMSTVQAASTYIQTEKYSSDWTKNSVYNSGRPSGVINFKGTIDQDEFEQIKKKFKAEYSGTENAGRTMLVNGFDGLDYQRLGMELGEVALKELREMSRDDIMMMWRVSKTILGISNDVNRANAKEARETWMENIIKPKMDRLVDHLNAFLAPRFGESIFITYDDPSPDRLEDKAVEWEKGVDKWLTRNEIRKERGLPPLPNGDSLLVPLNQSPMEGTPTPKKLKKKDLEDQLEKFRLAFYKLEAKYKRRFEKELVTIFNQQEREILEKNQKDIGSWLFNKEEYNRIFAAALVPLARAMTEDIGQFVLTQTNDNETQFEISPSMERYLTERIDRFVDTTNDNLLRNIEEEIAQGLKNGEGIPQLRQRINSVYSTTRSRAERIARTETLAISNEASVDAYRQSPVVKKKEWYAQITACEYCAALNGKIIGIDEDYLELGQTLTGKEGGLFSINYEDIGHPPVHPNCECVLLPVYD